MKLWTWIWLLCLFKRMVVLDSSYLLWCIHLWNSTFFFFFLLPSNSVLHLSMWSVMPTMLFNMLASKMLLNGKVSLLASCLPFFIDLCFHMHFRNKKCWLKMNQFCLNRSMLEAVWWTMWTENTQLVSHRIAGHQSRLGREELSLWGAHPQCRG